MNVDDFFSSCTNRSFHNFCIDNHIPFSAERLLGLGLKFCICDRPAPTDLSDFQFDRFRKEVRTRYFFLDTEDDNTEPFIPKIYVKNPAWTPDPASPLIENALDRFETSLRTLTLTNKLRHTRPNLTWYESNQLRLLRENKKVIILPSDKNLGPAALDMDRYVHQVLTEHLLDGRRYRVLEGNDAEVLREQHITSMWELFTKYYNDNCFSNREQQYIKRHHQHWQYGHRYRTPQFYGAPKVHKKGVPLRPIVSKVNSEIEILSIFLDHQLQRVLPLCKFYIRDSWHLLEKIRELGTLPPDARLVTVDAQAMYSNIDTLSTLLNLLENGLIPTNMSYQQTTQQHSF